MVGESLFPVKISIHYATSWINDPPDLHHIGFATMIVTNQSCELLPHSFTLSRRGDRFNFCGTIPSFCNGPAFNYYIIDNEVYLFKVPGLSSPT